jgi:hypothetical protein
VRRLVRCTFALACALVAMSSLATPAHAEATTDEAQFFADINAVRAQHAVAPLATDGQLISVARAWSSRMASDGAISHNPNLATQITNWSAVGENVGTGSAVATIEAAFEASPHHLENMVDPNYQYVGVGIVEVNGTIWVTEDYKRSKNGAPALAVPQNAPPPRQTAPRPAPARPAPAPSHAPTGVRPATASHAGASASASGAAPAGAAAPAPPNGVVSPAPPSVLGTRTNRSLTPVRGVAISDPRRLDKPRVATLAAFAFVAAAILTSGHMRRRVESASR